MKATGAKKRRVLRRALRTVIATLPKPWRYYLLRHSLKLASAPPELTIKLADTQQELEAALAVLHDSYVEEGFMKPHPSGMRLTKYHALPSTSTFVAKWNGEVVGTMSIIRDSIFGFPSDKILDVSHLREKGSRVAEPSGLAVRKDFQHKNNGIVLFSLCKYLCSYCSSFFGVDYWVIAVNPRHVALYEGLLFFKHLDQSKERSYEYVQGAPAVGLYTNLKDHYTSMQVGYWAQPNTSNLFEFLYRSKNPNLFLPDRHLFKISDPFLSPQSLNYFFNEKSDVFNQLTPGETRSLHTLYTSEEYKKVLPPLSDKTGFPIKRRDQRFEAKLQGEIREESLHTDIRITQIAKRGFAAVLPKTLPLQETVNVLIEIGRFEIAHIQAQTVWRRPDGLHGFLILQKTPNWDTTLQALQTEMLVRQEVASENARASQSPLLKKVS